MERDRRTMIRAFGIALHLQAGEGNEMTGAF